MSQDGDGVTEDSGDVFCTEPPSPTRPPAPGPVTTEQPPTYTSPPCRSVSPWDGVTEDSGDVFCSPPDDPTRPPPPAPIIGCTGTVTFPEQLDSIRDCTVLNGAIEVHNSTITMINLPLIEQITGKVFLEDQQLSVTPLDLTTKDAPMEVKAGSKRFVRYSLSSKNTLPVICSSNGRLIIVIVELWY